MATDKPIFYFDNRSPPVRSIRLLKEALKIDLVEKNIDLFKGEHLSEEFIKVMSKIDTHYTIIMHSINEPMLMFG